MTIEEAAARIGVAKRTIQRWIKTGSLPTQRVAIRDGLPAAHNQWRHDILMDDLMEAERRMIKLDKTCRNGHEWTTENTLFVGKKMTRTCRTCRNDYMRLYMREYNKKRAKRCA